ncbi:MAG: hypothetical protein FJ362_05570 [Gemmatimonadetes bacterium]|nr:hypothetical protein [Gemmatimonadota bacterium]
MEGPSVTTAAGPTLPKELVDLLVEFSVGMVKAAIYPPGHPILDTVSTGVLGRLNAVLATRPALVIGVAPMQLIVDAIATDPNHPVLRALATRLHQHQIGSIRITPGVTVDELERLMQTLGTAGSGIDRPLGLEGPDVLAQWPHLRLMALSFSSLALADGETLSIDDAEALWIRLVQIALPDLAVSGTEIEHALPATVAEAIERHEGDTEYDQTVMIVLYQLSMAINTRGGRDASGTRLRVSALVQKLGQRTLERLLHLGGDATRRRRFLQEVVGAVTTNAVLALAVAAATVSQQTISTAMRGMLSKLASQAEEGTGDQAAIADVALRQQVTELIERWTRGETDPSVYRAALDRLAARDPMARPTDEATPVEPSRVLAIGLEIETLGSSMWPAIDEMITRGEIEGLMDLVDQAPAAWMRDALWAAIATPARLDALTRRHPFPHRSVERLITRMGIAAVPVLVDALEAVTDPATIERYLGLLEQIGAPVARALVPHLTIVRWTTLRSLLVLLGRHPTWTSAYDPGAFSTHPDVGVRREAIRELLRDARQQGATMAWAFVDPDETIVRLSLAAAMGHCPREVASVLKVRADDELLRPEMRALAVRAVAGHTAPETPIWLASRVMRPARLLRRATLLPTTPELLAAVEGVAVHWGSHPAGREVLTLAAMSNDPAVRAATMVRRRGG